MKILLLLIMFTFGFLFGISVRAICYMMTGYDIPLLEGDEECIEK
jgi:hypothetical protein